MSCQMKSLGEREREKERRSQGGEVDWGRREGEGVREESRRGGGWTGGGESDE